MRRRRRGGWLGAKHCQKKMKTPSEVKNDSKTLSKVEEVQNSVRQRASLLPKEEQKTITEEAILPDRDQENEEQTTVSPEEKGQTTVKR